MVLQDELLSEPEQLRCFQEEPVTVIKWVVLGEQLRFRCEGFDEVEKLDPLRALRQLPGILNYHLKDAEEAPLKLYG